MADGYIADGTAAVTAGSATVTFTGVSVSLFRAGWPFNQGGASGTIVSLDADANTATLAEVWGGATSAGAAYSVLTIPQSRVLAETTVRWLEYLNGPILSIAQMMDADAPSDGETLVWDTAGWVATDLLASPTLSGHPTIEGVTTTGATGTGKAVFDTVPTFTGSVGIGMNPTSGASLETNGGFIQLRDSDGGTGGWRAQLYSYSGGFKIIAVDAQPMMFYIGGSEAARFDTGARLLVGYMSSNGSYTLQVNGQIFATSSTIATSHGPYKNNQQEIAGCLDMVCALTPKTFEWVQGAGAIPNPQFGAVTQVAVKKGERGPDGQIAQQDCTVSVTDSREYLREPHYFPGGTQIGFIAQEVQSALADSPFVNAIVKSNLREAPKDADGNVVGEDEEFLGIAEGNIIALLVGGMKEMRALITAQETRLATLESAVAALQAAH